MLYKSYMHVLFLIVLNHFASLVALKGGGGMLNVVRN
jgi:hypothetical protein